MKQYPTREYPIYIVWPEQRWVKQSQIISWFADAVANGEIAPERLGAKTPAEMAAALSDAGVITLGKPA